MSSSSARSPGVLKSGCMPPHHAQVVARTGHQIAGGVQRVEREPVLGIADLAEPRDLDQRRGEIEEGMAEFQRPADERQRVHQRTRPERSGSRPAPVSTYGQSCHCSCTIGCTALAASTPSARPWMMLIRVSSMPTTVASSWVLAARRRCWSRSRCHLIPRHAIGRSRDRTLTRSTATFPCARPAASRGSGCSARPAGSRRRRGSAAAAGCWS